MKNQTIKPLLAAAVVFGFLSNEAGAAVFITDFEVTESSVSFVISGTLEGPLPVATRDFLYFFNPSAPPKYTLGDNMSATSISFTGSQNLSVVSTGFSSSGDYFFLDFLDVFSVGAVVAGTVTATWSSPALIPSATPNINVYWGHNDTSAASGAFQTSAAIVPEPSAAAILTVAGALALARRKRSHMA